MTSFLAHGLVSLTSYRLITLYIIKNGINMLQEKLSTPEKNPKNTYQHWDSYTLPQSLGS
jgi:hypothetical protein